jgi:hypothetical protein
MHQQHLFSNYSPDWAETRTFKLKVKIDYSLASLIASQPSLTIK